MKGTQEAFSNISSLFSKFFVLDMNRRRTECFVHVDPNDEQYYGEAIHEATYFAEHDAARISDVIISIVYRNGGANALVNLAEDVATVNISEDKVTIEDSVVPASTAIAHMLALYDIDTNSKAVINAAAKEFSRRIESCGKFAAKYIDYISDLLDKEGGRISDLMEREPFHEWIHRESLLTEGEHYDHQ